MVIKKFQLCRNDKRLKSEIYVLFLRISVLFTSEEFHIIDVIGIQNHLVFRYVQIDCCVFHYYFTIHSVLNGGGKRCIP